MYSCRCHIPQLLMALALGACTNVPETRPVEFAANVSCAKVVCLATFHEIEPNSCSITVSIQNISTVAVDLGPIAWLMDQLCQVYVQVDGTLCEPKYIVQDGWPWNRLTTRGEYWDAVNNTKTMLVILGRESKDIGTTRVSWNPKAHEVAIWAQLFLPTEGSRISHKMGARGPVLMSNTLLIRCGNREGNLGK